MQSDNEIGQWKENDRRNIFLEKSFSKCGEATSLRPSFEFKIKHISRLAVWNCKKFLLIVRPFENYQNVLKLRCWSYKTFLKNRKKGLELLFLPHFLHDFSIKIFGMLYFINWPNFIVWFSLFLKIMGNMCIVIICFTVIMMLQILKLILAFLSGRFPTWPKNEKNNEGKYEFDVYRKSAITNIHINPSIPSNMIINVFKRATKICSEKYLSGR